VDGGGGVGSRGPARSGRPVSTRRLYALRQVVDAIEAQLGDDLRRQRLEGVVVRHNGRRSGQAAARRCLAGPVGRSVDRDRPPAANRIVQLGQASSTSAERTTDLEVWRQVVQGEEARPR
jgi:hypothetical protein